MTCIRLLTIVIAKHYNIDEQYGQTYRSTMCYPNVTTSKFVAISIFMKEFFSVFFFAFSLEFVSLGKKNISHAITPPK